jgi:putative spermidine/putrescine transport system substrate-binding protein
MLEGKIEEIAGGSCTVRLDNGDLIDAIPVNVSKPGERTRVSIRPERVEINPARLPEGAHLLDAEVLEFIYMGDIYRTRLRVAGTDNFIMKYRNAADQGKLTPDRMSASAGCQRIAVRWMPTETSRTRRNGGGSTAAGTPGWRRRPPDNRINREKLMTSRTLKLMGATSAISLMAMGAAQARTSLTVVSWGGAYTASQQRAYHEPYMEMNPHVTIINDDGSANALAGLRAQAQAGNVTWDLVDMLPSDAQLACDEGIILQIDPDEMLAPAPDGTPGVRGLPARQPGRMLHPADRLLDGADLQHRDVPRGPAADSIMASVRRRELSGPPRAAGPPGTNLEWALYADGVHPDDIYDVLATPEGRGPRLRQARHDQGSPDLLDRGRAGAAASGRQGSVVHHGLQRPYLRSRRGRGPALRDHLGRSDRGMGRLGRSRRTGRNLDAVMEYLYWATDTQRLADQAKFISYGPARASSAELVEHACRPGHRHEPAHADAPDNYYSPIVLDNDFWTDYGDELRERFANWMLQ